MPPVEALQAWMLLFVDYITTKQIIAPSLNTRSQAPTSNKVLSEALGLRTMTLCRFPLLIWFR